MTPQANKYYIVKSDTTLPVKYTGIQLNNGTYIFESKEVGIPLKELKSSPWLTNNDLGGIKLLTTYCKSTKSTSKNVKFFFKPENEIFREITLKEKFLSFSLYL